MTRDRYPSRDLRTEFETEPQVERRIDDDPPPDAIVPRIAKSLPLLPPDFKFLTMFVEPDHD